MKTQKTSKRSKQRIKFILNHTYGSAGYLLDQATKKKLGLGEDDFITNDRLYRLLRESTENNKQKTEAFMEDAFSETRRLCEEAREQNKMEDLTEEELVEILDVAKASLVGSYLRFLWKVARDGHPEYDSDFPSQIPFYPYSWQGAYGIG